MYSWLPEICKDIRLNLIDIYWTMIPLAIIASCTIETLKSNPDVKGVLTRSITSVILLISFPFIFDTIAFLGDGLSEKIRNGADIYSYYNAMNKKVADLNFSYLNLKSGILFVINMIAYLIARIGFFFTDALIHFMWAILYVLSPLMILAFVFTETTGVTRNLYAVLLKVMSWKVLFTLLSVLMIKFVEVDYLKFGDDNIVTTIIINLCVGFSMLFVPLFANSLFSKSGLTSFGTSLAVAASYTISGGAKNFVRNKVKGSKGSQKRPTHSPISPFRGNEKSPRERKNIKRKIEELKERATTGRSKEKNVKRKK